MSEDRSGGYHRSEEDSGKRLDRHWMELLQELRLVQTGTQILFAFLLTIAFQSKFQESDEFTHDLYAITLVSSALATALFLAPVSFHRIVFERQLRDRLVPITHHLANLGLVFLLIAICGSVLLALDVILARAVAIVVVALVLLWFVGFWYVLPTWVRRTSGTTK